MKDWLVLLLYPLAAMLIGFLAGYYQGLQEPRDPTFAERVYHHQDMKNKTKM